MAAIQHPLGQGRRWAPFQVPHTRVNWWLVGAIALAGLSATLPVLQNSTTTSRGFREQELQAQQASLNGDIRETEAQIAALTSQARIERRAQELGLAPGANPIYVHVDEAGPAPAKLPAEYLPQPTREPDGPDGWLRSLLSRVPLP